MINARDSKASRKLCVMLLEDDDADAYLTRRALSGLPQVGDVVRVKNGQQALDILQSGEVKPDIAFVDLQMPTMDGHEFLSASVDQGLANIPIVVLTSSSTPKDAMLSRVRGALRVITKMEDPAELSQTLEDAIDAFTGPARPAFAGSERKVATAQPEPSYPRPASAGAPGAGTPSFGRREVRPRS